MPETLCASTRAGCSQVVLHVWDYLDDRLTPDAMASLRAHIAECPECLEYQLFQQRFLEALGATHIECPAPWHVRARVLDVLSRHGFAPEEAIQPWASTRFE